ncbi:hypothetical protein NL676_001039 [Syzygium grande]|nr:hypothetical protein NL676_001039 [Syzygium grande]
MGEGGLLRGGGRESGQAGPPLGLGRFAGGSAFRGHPAEPGRPRRPCEQGASFVILSRGSARSWPAIPSPGLGRFGLITAFVVAALRAGSWRGPEQIGRVVADVRSTPERWLGHRGVPGAMWRPQVGSRTGLNK